MWQNNNPYWNGRLNEAYEMLSRCKFLGIYDELSSYLNKEEYYQEGRYESGLSLCGSERNKRIYTNCEAFSDYANLENSIKSIRQWENTR